MIELIGKRITGVFIQNGEGAIAFKTDDGFIVYPVDGDCCSSSWWSDIYNFDALIGTVADVGTLPMNGYEVDDGRGRQEVDSVYGYRVVTDKGSATLVFRNSSNGYYGGDLCDAMTMTSIDPSYTKITSDWKA